MFVAQVTVGAYLTLKKANVAAGLLVPLLVCQVLYHIHIHQRHFRVAARLPTEDSLRLDADGPTDFTFLKDKYKQAALKDKVVEPEYTSEQDKLDGGENDIEGRGANDDGDSTQPIEKSIKSVSNVDESPEPTSHE